MTKLLNIEQGSDDWNQFRGNLVTGTSLKDVLSSNDTRQTKSNKMLASLCGVYRPVDIKSAAIDFGNDNEELALEYFNNQNNLFAQPLGMMVSEDIKLFGVSPDAVIYECEFSCDKVIGGVEIKNPSPHVHFKYINDGGIPDEYFCQVLSMFLVNEDVEFWYFMSFCPELVGTDYEHLAKHQVLILKEDLDNLIKSYYAKKRKNKYESYEEVKEKLIEFTNDVNDKFESIKQNVKGE